MAQERRLAARTGTLLQHKRRQNSVSAEVPTGQGGTELVQVNSARDARRWVPFSHW